MASQFPTPPDGPADEGVAPSGAAPQQGIRSTDTDHPAEVDADTPLEERPTADPVGGQPHVRGAGPEAMASDPEEWDPVDQASDESFPASDPAPLAPGAD